jgi:fumarylacetoacetate (FAA) hydrolase
MKLASLMHGRDGRLVVVSQDLTRATDAFPVVPTLQAALDDWGRHAPRLADLAVSLEHGSVPSFRFHETDCAAPLPRAYQRLEGSAYLSHVEWGWTARGSEMPAGLLTGPLMAQGSADTARGPRQPVQAASEEDGIDFEGEIAVITGDVPMGVTPEAAMGHIRLVTLANAVSLRAPAGLELARGQGFVQARPAGAFSPVAVTPDELGAAWRGGRLHLPLLTQINGRSYGRPDAGVDMTFDFGILIAHAARNRGLGAGTIVGSGVVSNRDVAGGPSRALADGGAGYACIAEQRMAEVIRGGGVASTPFLRFGDTVRIEMKDSAGHSIFGAIEQEILPAG